MSRPEKRNVGKWKTEKYKVVVQRRQDYVGPVYYHFRVREKKIAGLYFRKVSNDSVSIITHSWRVLKLRVKSDTLSFDLPERK
jgi:hypothetical protein